MFKLIKEIRSKKGELHFKRWSILSTKWFNIYLHYINKADEDKDFHDHPWSFWSIILKGGYIEYNRDGKVRRTFLHSCYRKKEYPHKIGELIKPTWSLVITGKGGRKWGYHTKSGWVDFETYRNNKNLNIFSDPNKLKILFPNSDTNQTQEMTLYDLKNILNSLSDEELKYKLISTYPSKEGVFKPHIISSLIINKEENITYIILF